MRANETWKTWKLVWISTPSEKFSLFSEAHYNVSDEILNRLVPEESCPKSLKHIRLVFRRLPNAHVESKMSRLELLNMRTDMLPSRIIGHVN